MFKPGEIRIDLTEDRPAAGMWHCGPNACWITATHINTGASVRVYCSDYNQYKARADAVSLLEMAVEVSRDETPSFPERIQ